MGFSVPRLSRVKGAGLLAASLLPSILLADTDAKDLVTEDDSLRREFFQAGPWDADLGTSQAVMVGNMIIVSGVGARGPDLETQLKTIYIRIQSILGSFGATMADVVQERVYMTDLSAFDSIADSRKRYYREKSYPATTFVEVQRFRDPTQLIQIELVAVID